MNVSPTTPAENFPNASTLNKKIFWVFIHSLMIVLIAFKLMFFMRVKDDFSILVQLIRIVLWQCRSFTIFLLMWCIVQTVLYRVSGINVVAMDDNGKAEDYANLNSFIMLFMQIFRNSIGDISTPTYDYWTQPMRKETRVGLLPD